MKILESGEDKRNRIMLPNSVERKKKQTKSLRELEEEVNRINREDNRKRAMINKSIIAASILSTLVLLATTSSGNNKPRNKFNIVKVLRRLGYVASIISFIKGTSALSEKITVIDSSNPDMDKFNKDIRAEGVNINSSNLRDVHKSDKLRIKKIAVRATVQAMKEEGLVTKDNVSKSARTLKSKRIKGADPQIKDILTKEYS